jgi:hypothetical protein
MVRLQVKGAQRTVETQNLASQKAAGLTITKKIS